MLEELFQAVNVRIDQPSEEFIDDGNNALMEYLAERDAKRAKEANFMQESKWTPVYWVVKDAIPHINWETLIVLGRMLGYCQMKDGTCSASTDTLAKECRVSVRTVKYALQVLEAQQLMDDTTPNYHRRPHVYEPTEKLRRMLKKAGTNLKE